MDVEEQLSIGDLRRCELGSRSGGVPTGGTTAIPRSSDASTDLLGSSELSGSMEWFERP